jgi:hypothetical protein
VGIGGGGEFYEALEYDGKKVSMIPRRHETDE